MNSRPSDDLRLRAVAVARQDAVVRRAAEPEQAQRRLDELIARDAGVGGVGVFVGPVGGARQRPLARQQRPFAGGPHAGAGQPGVGDEGGERRPGRRRRSADRRRRRRAATKRTPWQQSPCRASPRPQPRSSETISSARYGGRTTSSGSAVDHGHALAVKAGVAHFGSESVGPIGVRLDGDDVQPALMDKFRDEAAGADAHSKRSSRRGRRRRRAGRATFRPIRRPRASPWASGSGCVCDVAGLGAEAVEPALARGHEQPAVGGQQVDRPALDRRLPGDARLARRQRKIDGEDSAHGAGVEARTRRRQALRCRAAATAIGRLRLPTGLAGRPHVIGPQFGRRAGIKHVARQDRVIADAAEEGARGES